MSRLIKFLKAKMMTALVYIVGIFLLLPLIAVIPISFTPKRFLSIPKDDWSLRHYEALVSSSDWMSSIGDSLIIALASSILSTILATAFALGYWYRQPRYGALLIGLAVLPMVVPPVVSAVVMYFLEARIGLIDTYLGLIIGHCIMVTPIAVIAMLTAISKLDRSIEMASRNLGSSTFQTTFFIVLPNLKFGLFSAWFLTLILSWEEVAVTLFISGIDVITLPKRIWDGLRLNVDPIIAAVSVILIIITVCVILIKFFIERRSQENHVQ